MKPITNEIPLKDKYLRHQDVKKTKGSYGGNSGKSGNFHNPPTGIRKNPKRRYG
jgi:hypothetical protein